MDARVEIALLLIREHYNNKLTLERISQEVNLTREHFSRLFKAETGLSPARYLKSLRLQKAKELVENTLMSVKEITYQVGINDESHFVRDFKLAYGLSPMQLRFKNINSFKVCRRFKPHINIR
jgi:transcriptional regulator GlxA family with amidase domain